MQNRLHKVMINAVAIVITAAIVLFGVYGWACGWFKDIDTLRGVVSKAGVMGPTVFVIIQILQVVLPFIPGGVTMTTGVLAFGPWWGFALNYIGVVTGSFINFLLARRFGKKVVLLLVDEKTYDKYIHKLSGKKYLRFFAWAILLPFFPDDTLCLLSGMTDMSYRDFSLIILLLKPPFIAVYSLLLIMAGPTVFGLLG